MSINDLIGKTLVSAEGKADEDELVFVTACGLRYTFYHSQDCCENVYIESIVGDLSDLVGEPILMAEEVSNWDEPEDFQYGDFSHTWTFYKFATRKGYVDVRWLGESNGYYSESVNLEITNA